MIPSAPFLAAGVEQIIVLAVVALFYVVKNLLEKKAGKGASPNPTDPFPTTTKPPAPSVARGTPASTGTPGKSAPEQERMRKFFEALGLPSEAIPPAPVAPKVERKAVPPPLAPVTRRVPPPPLPVPPRWEASPAVLAGDLPRADPKFNLSDLATEFRSASSVKQEKVSISVDVRADLLQPAAGVSVAELHRPVDHTKDLARLIARELRASPDSLKRAVILREILGPPVGSR